MNLRHLAAALGLAALVGTPIALFEVQSAGAAPQMGPGGPTFVDGALNYDSTFGQQVLRDITAYDSSVVLANDAATDPYSSAPMITFAVLPAVTATASGTLSYDAQRGYECGRAGGCPATGYVISGAPVPVTISWQTPPPALPASAAHAWAVVRNDLYHSTGL